MQLDGRSASAYIPRAVDAACLRALRAGRNFHVFGAPRTGKTRLRQRIAETLRASGLRVVEIDLARCDGGDLFYALALACAAAVGLGDPASFWDRFRDLEPAERWQRFLQTGPAQGAIVLLIDSVEALLADGHDAEGFFSALRPAGVSGRTPIVSCLFGTLQPVDLGVDIRTASLGCSAVRGWFRTAVRLRPGPFTAAELEGVLPRLEGPGVDARVVLETVLAWTGGHPALTVTLLDALADDGPLMVSGSEAHIVAATVDALFFVDPAAVPAFAAAERWTDCGDPAAAARWWARILAGETVGWRPGDDAHRLLCMAGLVWIDGSVLRPSNAIFTAVFDAEWCDARTLAEGLTARARVWRDRAHDESYLLADDLLHRASTWAEGRDVDPAIAELIAASWVHARRGEARAPVVPPPVQHSMPPAALPEAAPLGRIVAIEAAPPTVVIREPRRRPAPPTVPRVGASGRWLAVAVAAMALVTVGLLTALLQSRGGVERAMSVLTGQPAPVASSATGDTPRSGVASAPTWVTAAPAPARAPSRAVDPPAEPQTLAARRAEPGTAKTQAAEERAAKTRVAKKRATKKQAAKKRAAKKRFAKKRATKKQAAKKRAAKKRVAKKRAAKKRVAKKRAAKKRVAKERAAKKRVAKERAAKKQAAEKRAALGRAAPQGTASEAAARPGPIPAPAPAAAIARQAPSYRRALVRCKHYDLPQRVQLRLTVRPDGRVAQTHVARGGPGRIDHACLIESARRFRFAPFAGSAVDVTVDYRL